MVKQISIILFLIIIAISEGYSKSERDSALIENDSIVSIQDSTKFENASVVRYLDSLGKYGIDSHFIPVTSYQYLFTGVSVGMPGYINNYTGISYKRISLIINTGLIFPWITVGDINLNYSFEVGHGKRLGIGLAHGYIMKGGSESHYTGFRYSLLNFSDHYHTAIGAFYLYKNSDQYYPLMFSFTIGMHLDSFFFVE